MLKEINDKKHLKEKFIKAASSNSGRIHIVPSKDGWSVKREGSKRSSAVRTTKEEAIRFAKSLNSNKRIIIHSKDGTIQKHFKIQ